MGDEVLLYLEEEFGNARSRTHEFGRRARTAVEAARDRVAAVVDASRGDVFFTSGATESNNLAILGLSGHAIASRIEHHAVLEPMAELERRGCKVTSLDPEAGGWIDPLAVRDALRPDTPLVSIMQVNNETGVRQPVAGIADALGDHPALFHVDASQAFGKDMPVFAAKSYMGSLSAAAAPVELTASLFAMRDGTLPPTLNYETPDPECPINVIREPRKIQKPHVLKLSMTELGQVGAAVVRRWDG